MTNILSFDPSGNWKEGRGTTGVCVFDKGCPVSLSELRAGDHLSPESYWDAHVNLIRDLRPETVVMEGFRLYAHKKDEQTHSEFETPQLIGVIKWLCYDRGIPLAIQFASEVKSRWSDDILIRKGYLTKEGDRLLFNGHATNTHKRDSLRHALHYNRYKSK